MLRNTSIVGFVTVSKTDCVYCAVRAECLNGILDMCNPYSVNISSLSDFTSDIMVDNN